MEPFFVLEFPFRGKELSVLRVGLGWALGLEDWGLSLGLGVLIVWPSSRVRSVGSPPERSVSVSVNLSKIKLITITHK